MNIALMANDGKKYDEILKDSKEYEVLTSSEIYKVKNSGEVPTYALDINYEDVTKNGAGSYINIGKTKEVF